jgi:hypothetical protein
MNATGGQSLALEAGHLLHKRGRGYKHTITRDSPYRLRSNSVYATLIPPTRKTISRFRPIEVSGASAARQAAGA